MTNRTVSEKGVQRPSAKTLLLYRQEPEASDVGQLSVPCYVMATSRKPRPLAPDLGALLVPHLENPRLCSYSLGFMGVERRNTSTSLGCCPLFSCLSLQ